MKLLFRQMGMLCSRMALRFNRLTLLFPRTTSLLRLLIQQWLRPKPPRHLVRAQGDRPKPRCRPMPPALSRRHNRREVGRGVPPRRARHRQNAAEPARASPRRAEDSVAPPAQMLG